jgi:hypothetical protein
MPLVILRSPRTRRCCFGLHYRVSNNCCGHRRSRHDASVGVTQKEGAVGALAIAFLANQERIDDKAVGAPADTEYLLHLARCGICECANSLSSAHLSSRRCLVSTRLKYVVHDPSISLAFWTSARPAPTFHPLADCTAVVGVNSHRQQSGHHQARNSSVDCLGCSRASTGNEGKKAQETQ